ncbi:N-acetylmuramoyl-L-alanine amidase [Altericroceibacterium spongiae]|uniref:N-acetylmuramoyl-L-alanine amidase n=2 Tax=Altericroceibacterium spongiae TaxID=2320269 RepID=A0A420ERD7_9SPHN|nr:N-acetylmuramoyl-L-alanine amidase [Altericroceibacterium spongiae]
MYRWPKIAILLGGLIGVGVFFALAWWLLLSSKPIPDYVLRIKLPHAGKTVGLPHIEGAESPAAPLVVIDPGHGGYDPGASGSGLQEKAVVLRLAQALRNALLEQGGVRVAMTRRDDRFLVLDERVAIARDLGANLFISIHADSGGSDEELSGASVYTLSNEASSEAAARFAVRENESNIVNGASLDGRDDKVTSILVELSQRQTQENSVELAELILREGRGQLDFLSSPRRSAALRVLRAPDIPSVLYEAGFISNQDDAAHLASAEGRKTIADSLARAVRIYFIRHSYQQDSIVENAG